MASEPMEREQIISALRLLIQELGDLQSQARIRIVGGAALSLVHFERLATVDVDSLSFERETSTELELAIARVANRLGWPADWLNTEVQLSGGVPTLGKEIHWQNIYSDRSVRIDVAPAEAMLVMKLRANRPGRDTDDIRKLIATLGIVDVNEIESLYEDYYPAEPLSQRALGTAVSILSESELKPPEAPPPPQF